MKKLVAIIPIFMMMLFAFTGLASAHVKVYPENVQKGAYEKFTVRVPSEKDVPTTMVKIEIPEGVEVSRFKPIDGWTYTIEKDSSGKMTSVTWKADGEGLTSTEFGEFEMQGKVGEDTKELTWKAYQTYQDGSVIKWIGLRDSENPASITTISQIMESDQKTELVPTDDEKKSNSLSLPLYLSVGAFILGIIGVIISLTRKKGHKKIFSVKRM